MDVLCLINILFRRVSIEDFVIISGNCGFNDVSDGIEIADKDDATSFVSVLNFCLELGNISVWLLMLLFNRCLKIDSLVMRTHKNA